MKNLMVMASIIFLLITTNSTVFAFGMVKINVKVVDESGAQLGDTKLRVRFTSGEIPAIKSTDDHGHCSFTSNSGDGVVVGTAMKDGYYDTTLNQDFYRRKFGMWQPWGKELTVVMRPIVNPVPMYVRNQWFEIPAVDKEIGFDLEKADWVIPYGLGTQSDFIFKVNRRYDNIDNFDATVTLTFSNPFDGIQVVKDDGGGDFNVGSWYRLPRKAPEDGYQPKLTRNRSTSSPDFYAHKPDDDNYIFRVRSEVDKDGKLKQAMYGKIRGSIALDPRGSQTGTIKMHYYLNPDYTPNLEFDPQRNLFISLPSDENVRQP
ncbi:MAG: hypothetical protein E4G91_03880 [Candidatus Zixiibacteriota bacterium]|nr:MAG: hypothetical protein E4G91_03880 [candidate division Zixibacteria bacterium]